MYVYIHQMGVRGDQEGVKGLREILLTLYPIMSFSSQYYGAHHNTNTHASTCTLCH